MKIKERKEKRKEEKKGGKKKGEEQNRKAERSRKKTNSRWHFYEKMCTFLNSFYITILPNSNTNYLRYVLEYTLNYTLRKKILIIRNKYFEFEGT